MFGEQIYALLWRIFLIAVEVIYIGDGTAYAATKLTNVVLPLTERETGKHRDFSLSQYHQGMDQTANTREEPTGRERKPLPTTEGTHRHAYCRGRYICYA